MAKDSFSIRITFSSDAEEFAQEFIEFIEDNFDGLNIQKPREGNNPKYQPLTGQKYRWIEDEFTHSVMGFSKENLTIEKILNEYLAKTYDEGNFIILKIGNEKTVHRLPTEHST